VGGFVIFSAEHLLAVASRTGFQATSLQKQMLLIAILREMQRHPILGKSFVLRGGTAINLFWFNLPRLSVDIDLNYVGSPDKEVMQQDRLVLEKQLIRLLQSLTITVERQPPQHAGGKWRLRTRSAFGGNVTLEIDLNYMMRIPIWDVQTMTVHSPDPDYETDFPIVSFEELFAGKIKAMLERSAARDLYDVHSLSRDPHSADPARLRKAVILFGTTSKDDWRKKDLQTIDAIDDKTAKEELSPLLRSGEEIGLPAIKQRVKSYLSDLIRYDKDEQRFLDRFLDQGIYDPTLLFGDTDRAVRLGAHPAVLWKLQNLRQHLGLDKPPA
jgi:predicted nucleotidyltransferase component of viral defense system